MDIYCAVCGQTFTPKDRQQRLCSMKCRGKWVALIRPARVPVERSCSKCGVAIQSKGRSLAFCDDCRSPERVCPQCGTSFRKTDRRARFCSVSCRATYSRRNAASGPAHPLYKGGKPYAGAAWFTKRDAARDRDGWLCADCGKARPAIKLNVHHLVARTDWGNRPGHPDDIGNLVTLCVNCHRKRHPMDPAVRRAGWVKRRARQAV